MKWLDFFHNLVIPFIAGISLTLAKLIADRKPFSFDDSNDIALDLVLLGVGALGAFYAKGGKGDSLLDAGVGDAFFAVVLLYFRHLKNLHTSTDGPIRGIVQLGIGVMAIVWTMMAV